MEEMIDIVLFGPVLIGICISYVFSADTARCAASTCWFLMIYLTDIFNHSIELMKFCLLIDNLFHLVRILRMFVYFF